MFGLSSEDLSNEERAEAALKDVDDGFVSPRLGLWGAGAAG